ncbi:MAG TPA: BatA domain-containing protein, partial [Rhizomicrobium sp.]|nr:BatA domain-containing protein [Rhizomicrobium sp.]
MGMLAQLSFGTPLLLATLVVLPVIWWLLRVTPPSPRRVVFPPLRLLLGLRATEETPARTPWWLLALRLFVAALVIFALAEPLLGESKTPAGSGPLVFFVDNGWTAAHRWGDRESAISDALRKAQKDGRAVAIVPTAAKSFATVATLLDAGAAERAVRELEPQPWLPERTRAIAALAKLRMTATPEIVWLSDGLDYGDARATANALAKLGNLRVLSDAPGRGPLALRPAVNDARGFRAMVVRGDTRGTPSGAVNAIGIHGEQLATAPFKFAEGKNTTEAQVRLPIEVRNEMAM